jgi:hypothetical protein
MDKNNNFKFYTLNTFCEKYNISKEKVVHNPHFYFRYFCFKYNFFIKHLIIPKIKKKK